jgi:hypothetical protein
MSELNIVTPLATHLSALLVAENLINIIVTLSRQLRRGLFVLLSKNALHEIS